MKYNGKIAEKWIEVVQKSREPLNVILTTHLIAEHAIDYLIFTNCPNHTTLLSNVGTYTFSVKLNILYAAKIISRELYENVKKLNKLRNEYAHNLEIDFKNVDLNYNRPSNHPNLADFKKTWNGDPTNDEIVNIVLWIAIYSSWVLHNLIRDKKEIVNLNINDMGEYPLLTE